MRNLLKGILELGVDTRARVANFSFPPNFTWRWKWAMLSQAYERETMTFLEELVTPGMTVIDIGAHVGYMTRLFARKVGVSGHVYAFEAASANFALLERNTKHLSNVTLSPLAIAAQVGTVRFFTVINGSGTHSTIKPERETVVSNIPATALDVYLQTHHIDKVSLIKMDIEGGEWDALKGMTEVLKQDVKLIMEWCPKDLRVAGIEPVEILRLLSSKGFILYALTKDGAKEIPSSNLEDAYLHLMDANSHGGVATSLDRPSSNLMSSFLGKQGAPAEAIVVNIYCTR